MIPPRTPPPLTGTPLISVITVSFNQGEFIRQNIESVLAQHYPSFEHIIIDGCSKDNTLSILKEYPHLKWVSEPDRNQCHALNKGFARASGDIICWLNSDDWLAPGAFDEVAARLKTCEVLMTAAAETDKAGNVKQIVQNAPRTFFDILRYWIPYAWLAQTGIFFRRSLLEEVKRGGEYVDESLYFVMDMDLWLRMARLVPFTEHSDKVCAYFRMWEENETGKSPLSTQKECGRAFRRCINEICRAERPLTFVMPLNRVSPEITHSLNSLVQQESAFCDLILADYSSSREESELIKRVLEEIEKNVNILGARYLRVKTTSPIDAMLQGMKAATSPLAATLWPGDAVDSKFSIQALSSFAVDPAGLILPAAGNPELKRVIYDERTLKLRLDGLLTDLPVPFSFVARKALVEEVEPLISKDCPVLAMRQILTLAAARGWYISPSETLTMKSFSGVFHEAPQKTGAYSEKINALLIKLAADVQNHDAFGATRIKSGWGMQISKQAEEAAGIVLKAG